MFKQTICNARDLAATLNDLVVKLAGASEAPWIIRLENNDDVLICWYSSETP